MLMPTSFGRTVYKPVASQSTIAARTTTAAVLPPKAPPPGMMVLSRSWPRRRISSRSGGPPPPPPLGPEPHGPPPPEPPPCPHGPPPPLWLLQGMCALVLPLRLWSVRILIGFGCSAPHLSRLAGGRPATLIQRGAAEGRRSRSTKLKA